MRQLADAWFEYAGINCGEKGLRILSMPRRYSPVARGNREEISSRNGFLWLPDGGYMPVEISVDCETLDGYNTDEINAWLMNNAEAWLRFSDEPDRAYKAYVLDAFSAENRFLRFDRKHYTIRFVCQPNRYEYPESDAVVLTAAGTVENPGTAQSEPRIAVTATGDYTLVVNGCMMEVKGGSIIIDSELRDCLSEDGASLANSRVTMDEFPKLDPGANNVSWTGNVTKVEIARRVRYL